MFAACLLGPHRICLRQVFNLAQTQHEYWASNIGLGCDFCGDDYARRGTQSVSEVEAASISDLAWRSAHVIRVGSPLLAVRVLQSSRNRELFCGLQNRTAKSGCATQRRYLAGATLGESGSLKINSPGRASPISSRAMRSMALGSVFSELTCSARNLFSALILPICWRICSISRCVRRMAMTPC